MDIPESLRAALKRLEEKADTANIVAAAKSLSEGYRSSSQKPSIRDRAGAEAYALSRMPATCAAFCDVFSRVRDEFSPSFLSALDLGAGTGGGAFAVSEVFGPVKTVSFERSPAMIGLGKELAGSSLNAEWIEGDVTLPSPAFPKADLVSAGYLLNEIGPEKRETFLSRAFDAAEKALLLIEPGTPGGFSLLCEAKKFLLSRGAFLTFPCPGGEKCPLEGKDWCAFSCRVQRSRIHRLAKGGDAPFEDEKYCCALFSRSPFPEKKEVCRIVRRPLIEKGKVTLTLCDGSGVFAREVREKDGTLFKAARKSAHGGLFPSENS